MNCEWSVAGQLVGVWTVDFKCVKFFTEKLCNCGSDWKLYFQIRMVKVKLSSLLAKEKGKDVLMNFQKTKNCRDKKRQEERAEKKRDNSKIRYMKVRKDKVKGWESVITESKDRIKKWKDDIQNVEAKINKEEIKIAKATAEKEKEVKKLKKKTKKK